MEDYNVIWQRIGAFLGPILLALLISIKFTDPGFSWLAFFYWAFVPLVMIHETEEYIIRGGFKEWANLKSPFSMDPPQKDYPLTYGYELAVNMLAWGWAIFGGLLVYTLPWVGMAFIIFMFVLNGIQHTAIFQSKEQGANPGFYTAWLVLNPFSVVVIFYALKTSALTSMDWILSLILGFVVFFILMSITRSRMK
ncbi:MAG: HXXEE domain-containing protein [Methanobacterium sp.]